MSVSQEEFDKMKKEMEEMKTREAELQQKLEDEKVMRESTQRLLDNQDLLKRRQAATDQTKRTEERTVAEGEKALGDSVDAILNKFSEEDFDDPAKLRAIFREFGMQAAKIAYQEATGRTLKVVNEIVRTTANIQDVTAKWRRDNPDLVPHERMVEFFFEKHTNPEDSIEKRIEDATKQTRDQLGIAKKEGKEEERRSSNNVNRQRVMTPAKSGAGKTSQEEEEETPTLSEEEQRKDLGNFLSKRRQLNETRGKTRY